MQTLVFLDLDDTLFQTLPKCPAGETLHTGALGRDGQPLSYLTERQRCLFDLFDAVSTVIPTTARNRDAFSRVQLPFRSFAILNFGGVILQPDGKLEQNWDRHIRPQAQKIGSELQQVLAGVDGFIQTHHLGARARLISDFGMPLYVVIKHPQVDLQSLRTIFEEHLTGIDQGRFFIHFNHNNLSIAPRFLGKDKAIRYLLEQHFAAEPVLTLGIGDSLTDLPYLQTCDFMMLPRRSQLAETLLESPSTPTAPTEPAAGTE